MKMIAVLIYSTVLPPIRPSCDPSIRWENGCGGCKTRKTTSLKVNAVESRAYFSVKCMDFFPSEITSAAVCFVRHTNTALVVGGK